MPSILSLNMCKIAKKPPAIMQEHCYIQICSCRPLKKTWSLLLSVYCIDIFSLFPDTAAVGFILFWRELYVLSEHLLIKIR